MSIRRCIQCWGTRPVHEKSLLRERLPPNITDLARSIHGEIEQSDIRNHRVLEKLRLVHVDSRLKTASTTDESRHHQIEWQQQAVRIERKCRTFRSRLQEIGATIHQRLTSRLRATSVSRPETREPHSKPDACRAVSHL